jgi:hypothetical protein
LIFLQQQYFSSKLLPLIFVVPREQTMPLIELKLGLLQSWFILEPFACEFPQWLASRLAPLTLII